MRVVVTCTANTKGFDSEKLLSDKNCDRGTFKILVDKHLVMVIKYRNILKPYKLSVLKVLKVLGNLLGVRVGSR